MHWPDPLSPRRPLPAQVTEDVIEQSWQRIRGELRGAVTDPTWHLWLEGLQARELDGDTLVVEAPDGVRTWVRDRYGRLLQACAAAILGPDVRVDLVAPRELEPRAPDGLAPHTPAPTRTGRPYRRLQPALHV